MVGVQNIFNSYQKDFDKEHPAVLLDLLVRDRPLFKPSSISLVFNARGVCLGICLYKLPLRR